MHAFIYIQVDLAKYKTVGPELLGTNFRMVHACYHSNRDNINQYFSLLNYVNVSIHYTRKMTFLGAITLNNMYNFF